MNITPHPADEQARDELKSLCAYFSVKDPEIEISIHDDFTRLFRAKSPIMKFCVGYKKGQFSFCYAFTRDLEKPTLYTGVNKQGDKYEAEKITLLSRKNSEAVIKEFDTCSAAIEYIGEEWQKIDKDINNTQ